MRKINYTLGASYFLVILVAFFIKMAFPFEILQEVITVDHRNNYALSNIVGTIVGLMMMFALAHLGFMIGVATTEESLKKI
jgi:hypothetical protein